MTLIRYLARHVFGSILPKLDEKKAWKYMTIARLGYFIGASSLFYLVNKKYSDTKQNLDLGLPIVEDFTEAHAQLRKRGDPTGKLILHTKGKGFQIIDYDRKQYLAELEQKAYEKSLKHQLEVEKKAD